MALALAATLLSACSHSLSKSRITTARVQIKSLESALEHYRIEHGRYPEAAQGLAALLVPSPTLRNQGYLDEVPLDPWGNPYRYRLPGRHNNQSFDLWSLGADGSPGGRCLARDIGNWPPPTESIFECPKQHPLYQGSVSSGFVTLFLAAISGVVLAGVRAIGALRGVRSWRSVVSPPPRSLGMGLALTFFALLFWSLVAHWS